VEKLWAIRRVGWLLDEIQLHGKSQEIIDELVRLSRDYGIMTPYTSFLADERTALSSAGELRRQGGWALRPLARTSGREAHRGAVSRKMLREMDRPQADYGGPAKPAGEAGAKDAQSPWYARMRYPKNWKQDKSPQAGGAPAGAVLLGDLDGDDEKAKKLLALANVRQIGNHTVLYRRGKVWLMPETAGLKPGKDAAHIVEVKRFSKAYFELVRENTREQNEVLATQQAGEKLLVKFRGQVYSIAD
jgi:Ca-activated chloride channel family protein